MKKIIVLMMLFSITFINRVIAEETNDSDESIIKKCLLNSLKKEEEKPKGAEIRIC